MRITKNVFVILLSIAICFAFLGCGARVEKQNAEARAILTKVINKETGFILHNSYIGKATETTFEKCYYPTMSDALNIFTPLGYIFSDFDGDGIDELLVMGFDMYHFLFMKYDGEKVHAYDYKKISAEDVGADGSFITMLSFSDNRKAISRVSFGDNTMNVTYEAYCDENDGEYKLNGKDADKETVEEYFEDWYDSSEKLSWTYTRDYLDVVDQLDD